MVDGKAVAMATGVDALCVTIIQSPLHWHDALGNRRMFENKILALDAPGDVIVLPEMFASGFTQSPQLCAEEMDGDSVAWMRSLAKQTGAAITGSLAIRSASGYRNRLLWAAPNGELAYYDKRHLFRMAGEHEHYQAGSARTVIAYRGWRICPQICYDLRFPVWSRYGGDYDVLLFVANWPSPRHQAWHQLLRARAIENQCYTIGVNRIGSDRNGWDFLGGSAVVDFLGNTLATCDTEESSVSANLNFAALTEFRQAFPFARDADAYELRS